MIYREHPPHAALVPYVACYWSLRGRLAEADAHERAVVPDACMDILFNLAPEVPGSAASQVVGTMTRPLPVRRAGALDLLGVRFRAGGAVPFLYLSAREVTDDALALEDVWGSDADALTDRLRQIPDTAGRIRVLDEALRARAEEAGARADEAVLAATRLAERAGGTVDVDALARTTGLGRRQLERRFLAVVGIPPKTACRVLRFQAALARLHAPVPASLSRVALEAGYHDQAHFTRDFKAFAGVTPGAYVRTLPRSAEDAFVQDGHERGP